MKLPKDFREFIESLNSENVKYLIVGGFAVAFHGYPRFTGDIDFFIEASSENAARMCRALRRFGFADLKLSERDFLESDRVVQLGVPPRRIDIMTGLSGISFAEAWSSRIESTLDDLPVNFIGKAMLIENKIASGRTRDRADIEEISDEDGGANPSWRP